MTFYCFYCNTEKPTKAFNTEHTLSKALGNFGADTPTFSEKLTCRVCKKCNQKFGDTLERCFSRESLEGHWRFHNNVVKNPADFLKNQHGKTSNYVFVEPPINRIGI